MHNYVVLYYLLHQQEKPAAEKTKLLLLLYCLISRVHLGHMCQCVQKWSNNDCLKLSIVGLAMVSGWKKWIFVTVYWSMVV